VVAGVRGRHARWFALQDSLAGAVAEALRSRFGGAPIKTPHGEAGTSDVQAYDLFLRARFLFRQLVRLSA